MKQQYQQHQQRTLNMYFTFEQAKVSSMKSQISRFSLLASIFFFICVCVGLLFRTMHQPCCVSMPQTQYTVVCCTLQLNLLFTRCEAWIQSFCLRSHMSAVVSGFLCFSSVASYYADGYIPIPIWNSVGIDYPSSRKIKSYVCIQHTIQSNWNWFRGPCIVAHVKSNSSCEVPL